jgi:hypothetical protein
LRPLWDRFASSLQELQSGFQLRGAVAQGGVKFAEALLGGFRGSNNKCRYFRSPEPAGRNVEQYATRLVVGQIRQYREASELFSA